jgi:hypothetical protein
MRSYLLIISLVLLAACGGGKKIQRTTEDRTLIKTIKDLDKHPDNAELRASLADLYKQAAQTHLDKIEVYNKTEGLDKWDKIITEYEALRSLSEMVNSSPNAQKTLSIPSYVKELETAKQVAAAAYYNSAVAEMSRDDRESYRQAWYDFRRADQIVPGFKDARGQMSVAFQKGTVSVVINPVRDNTSFYSNLGWNRYGNSFNNDLFQRNLVRDLGGVNNRNLPALFYTDWEVSSNHITPDWQVDLTWENLDIPRPYNKQYSRDVDKSIEVGRDTAGKSIYQTVRATLNINKLYFTAIGDIQVQISDIDSKNTIFSQRYTQSYEWKVEWASFHGDSRALSNTDWNLINNKNHNMPRNEEILEELYRRIYPQVKSGIYNAVRW